MTEDEAKTKWCPFARVAGTESEWHTNRPSHADVAVKPFDHCIGSACMAWRDGGRGWGEEIERIAAERGAARPGEDWFWEVTEDQKRAARGDWVRRAPGPLLGDCGLATSVVVV